MPIADHTHRPVVSVDQAATLTDAARLMRHHHVGALVVTARAEGVPAQVVGLVTDRDLAVEGMVREGGGGTMRVGQIMSTHLVAVPAAAGIPDALALMKEHGVRRLLVTAEDGRLAGIVSTDDLVDALVGELGLLAQALRSDIEREARERPDVAAPVATPLFLPAGTPGLRWPTLGRP